MPKRLTCCKPIPGDPLVPHESSGKPADDRTRGVPVARNGDRRPERFGVVPEVAGEGPEAERNGVGTDRLQAGANLQGRTVQLPSRSEDRPGLFKRAWGRLAEMF